MIDRLRDEHRHIATLAAQVEACLAEAEPPLARLGNARWVLARALFAHIVGDAGDSARRAAFLRDPLPLRQQLHEHIAQWGTPQILADWQGYRAAEARLLAALRTRIAREALGLSPALADREPATLQ